MKKFIFAGVAIISASTAVMAADLAPPLPAAYDWTGFYMGLNAGAAWNRSSIDVTDIGGAVPAALVATVDGEQTVFSGGGQIGYNWQMDSLVLGLETDLNYLGFSDDESRSSGLATADFDIKANWFGTARARLGFAADNMLFYATGGLAYGHVKASGQIDDGAGSVFSGSESNVNWGYTVGGGMEYAFDENWILGAEYLYVDLGNPDNDFTCTGACALSISSNVDAAFSVVRAKLDFKF
jgi:outer membrane immunogenic protein